MQFFTTDGVDARIDCRVTIRPDRTFRSTPDNPRCLLESPGASSGVAFGFPLVITELSDSVLELRASRLEFVSSWIITDFALRTEVTNPTTPFVTPRADFRSTL